MILAIKRLIEYQKKKKFKDFQMAEHIDISQAMYSFLVNEKRAKVSDETKQRIEVVTNRYIKITDWFKEAE